MNMKTSMFLEDTSIELGNKLENDNSELNNEQNYIKGPFLFRSDLLEEVRRRPVLFSNDLDISLDLFNLVTQEFKKFGTSRDNLLNDEQINLALRTFLSVLQRMGISLKLPFRDFITFQDYWRANGMSGDGGWAKRRTCIENVFSDVREKLEKLEDKRLTKPLAEELKQKLNNWPNVDEEIRELRRKFDSAVTKQDFRALGTNCLGVLQEIGRVVHDPSKDLREGEKYLPEEQIKEVLDRYVERRLPGNENEELRKTVKSTIALAHRLKHRLASSPEMAGITADSVLLVASMIRRLADDSVEKILNDKIPF